jgi:uncharacterized membrane protein
MKTTKTIQTKITVEQTKIVWEDFGPILAGAMILMVLVALGEEFTFLFPLRVVLGLTYVLFIPGYCLTMAIFPRINDLKSAERISLSIGLSVASVSILALLLDWLHLGLFPWPILLTEFGGIGLFIAMTLWRRLQLPFDEIYISSIAWQPSWNSLSIPKKRLYNVLMVGLLMAGLAAWIFLTPATDPFTTEFYILGSKGFVESYPYNVRINDGVQVKVGVINREKSEINYHFEVWVTDNLILNKRERVLQSESFLLKPGEKFENSVSWRMPWAGEDQKAELLLFYENDSKPARQLQMWINVRE